MSASEQARMQRLSGLVHQPAIRAELLAMAARLRSDLARLPREKSTQASVSLSLYGEDLDGEIGSSWVFVLRENHDHPAERHPNSIQRMFALDSPGAMEVWEDGRWVRRDLAPGEGDAGLSIPASCWHRPARLESVWGVVSFHTVAPEDLIEEVGDPATGETAASRHYVA